MRTPVFYISHGGPNLLEDVQKPGKFYTWFGKYIQQTLKPKAIVIISAHWQGEGKEGIFVDTSEKPKLIYDFYGFPKKYYAETWNHQGSPKLASQVIDLLTKSGIKATGEKYGNDHGVWVPLKRSMESNPDIPIVEVSTFGHESMQMHTKMGEVLEPLRDEGVLIIGSGSAVHNLRELWSSASKPSPTFVRNFDQELDIVACQLTGEERKQSANKLNQHPDFRRCHPTAEHLVPFHVVVAAAGEDTGKKLLTDYFGTLSWSCYGFGLPEDVNLPAYT
ncbi:hypothetical protein G6F56_008746 [Rhizopus delemar]|uniref:Extradiol ring-cleavage dioxygenase class III enzyme subunit B domain-containing protein n=1 Tax=Rhizopus stolonifer TaxID=4846 RepID=A0A367ISC8_RHIST|nr:hypothetical protein G6F56_008746 [Rhizopus delemar]RCH80595.1 hypothetical protein CU098_005365 [Rhizopus stolonifer]